MHPLAEKVGDIIRAQNFFPGSGNIIVAVSGGIDSMALLHLLATPGLGLLDRLVVAHFNHQLRGADSDADAAFVGEAAGQLGLPFESDSGDTQQLAAETGEGIEATGFLPAWPIAWEPLSPWLITPTIKSKLFFSGCFAARATAAWPACSPSRHRQPTPASRLCARCLASGATRLSST